MASGLTKKGKDRWLIRIDFGRDANGTRQRYSEIFHGLQKYAEQRRVELLSKKNKGEFTWSTKETVDEWLDKWLESTVKAKRAKTTYQQYKQIAKNYIRPVFGSKKLSVVSHGDVQATFDRMTLSGLSPSTVRYTNAVLKLAFRDAIRIKKLTINPCIDIELPRQKRAKETIKAMTKEEARRFIEASYTEPFGIVYRVALECGTRMEETLGLRWSDLSGNKLSIRRALVYSRERGEGWFFQPTKTPSGDRTITISDLLVNELKEHRIQQLHQMILLGIEYNRDLDLMFANDFGGVLHQDNLRRRTFKRILKAAGLSGFAPHCLRHTAATIQLHGAPNPKAISQRLGHSSVKFTLDRYTWTQPGQEEDVAAIYAGVLYGGID